MYGYLICGGCERLWLRAALAVESPVFLLCCAALNMLLSLWAYLSFPLCAKLAVDDSGS